MYTSKTFHLGVNLYSQTLILFESVKDWDVSSEKGISRDL